MITFEQIQAIMGQDGLIFIIETIQGKRKRSKKYRHYVKIPIFLYDELIDAGVLNLENFFIDETIFVEADEFFVTLNFITYSHVNDIHIRILDYLVKRLNGNKNLIERGGYSF